MIVRAARLALPLAIAVGVTIPPGELDGRVVRVRAELDVFAPSGPHSRCTVKLLAPLCLPPQLPLRVSVATEPAGEAESWRIDDDGQIEVALRDQTGEKHVLLVAEADVLLLNGVGFDDASRKSTLFKRAAPAPLEPYLRPLAGAGSEDPDLAKAAAELQGRSGDVLALVRGADELVVRRVPEQPDGTNDAGEGLRKGGATKLGRARLAAALALRHGVPSRILLAVPARGGGEVHCLGDFHAGEPGWLRLDLLHRHAPAFPWPEIEDVVLAEINADSPLAANSRPRSFFCTGGLTAGPRTAGAALHSCRELAAVTCSRATAKQVVPVLAAAFADVRKERRGPAEKLDALAAPRARKSRALVEWSASFAPALETR